MVLHNTAFLLDRKVVEKARLAMIDFFKTASRCGVVFLVLCWSHGAWMMSLPAFWCWITQNTVAMGCSVAFRIAIDVFWLRAIFGWLCSFAPCASFCWKFTSLSSIVIQLGCAHAQGKNPGNFNGYRWRHTFVKFSLNTSAQACTVCSIDYRFEGWLSAKPFCALY